ncbi:MAG TPA: bifunctional isocitrate dehydrogenase kinase/phosphatase [Burkholderiaceae bacterium]|nr:bifunctional isocitrate dehydrogenase kinase/phosphatase [Burkholderiaceae bacterium]
MPSPAKIAHAILDGFDNHYRRFRYVAQQAKALFENGNWQAIRERARERIDFYDLRVNEAAATIESNFDLDSLTDLERDALWQAVKQSFVALLAEHRQPECAETFFNSVCTRILHRDYFQNRFIFVRPGVATEYMDSDPPSYRSYYPATSGLKRVLRKIVIDFGLACPWEDVERDIRRVVRAVVDAHRSEVAFRRPWHIEPDFQLQILSNLFFRNKGAYIVGRVVNGTRITPVAVPILRNADGTLYMDAALFTADLMTVLFSFTHAYFLVDMEAPAAYIDFLRSILPGKPSSELYTSVGLAKQGKTLFYRDFLHHLKHSQDEFIAAPGIKGLVMAVFTLPSYPYVFKLIKDVIPHPKDTDRPQVMAKYQLVKLHDRVGRMADTWEYSQVTLPRLRFSPALLRELLADCASIVEVDDKTVLIKHVYIERRLTPLNIYLTHATDDELDHAVLEYGNAIKELAAANIFPGDMLYKNFGVTRLNRVVFYDYDEIEYMTACEFRAVPHARNEEEEMSHDVWYSVGAHDMFPEKWGAFLLGDDRIRAAFSRHHADLLTPAFWNARKQSIQAGQLENVFPYPQNLRFNVRFAERHAAKSGAPIPGQIPS